MYSCRLLLPLLHLLAIHVYRFSTMYTQAHWLYISVTPPLIGCVVLPILCLSTWYQETSLKFQFTLFFRCLQPLHSDLHRVLLHGAATPYSRAASLLHACSVRSSAAQPPHHLGPWLEQRSSASTAAYLLRRTVACLPLGTAACLLPATSMSTTSSRLRHL